MQLWPSTFFCLIGGDMALIYEDTRQQRDKHTTKHLWFGAHGVELVRKKLEFGDYESDGSNISIDTKRGIQEICKNVTRDHQRFVREIERAECAGYRLVFLIEQGKPFSKLEDLAIWRNDVCSRCTYRRYGKCDVKTTKCIKFARKPVQGQTLLKILLSIQAVHGCSFELVSPSDSARRICELLGVTYDDGPGGAI